MDGYSGRDLFKKFVGEMNDVFGSEEFKDRINGQDQESLLGSLFKEENTFKKTLQSTPEGKAMYAAFMKIILTEKKNILSASVYFRETQSTISSKIFGAFRKEKPHLLYRFRINYMFAKWVMDRYGKSQPKYRKLNNHYKKIISIRKTLCEQNLPLAINRAKIHWSKAPSFHLEYMDLIQSSAEGLLTALDKFVPPYRSVWRSVAISRMTLNMNENSKESLIRFSAKEKRILYRANLARKKERLQKDEDILEFVQQSFDGVTQQNLGEIVVAASGILSMDKNLNSYTALGNNIIKDDKCVSKQVEEYEITSQMMELIENLTLFEKKILLLKFGKITGLDV